jgi:hypothetical protein
MNATHPFSVDAMKTAREQGTRKAYEEEHEAAAHRAGAVHMAEVPPLAEVARRAVAARRAEAAATAAVRMMEEARKAEAEARKAEAEARKAGQAAWRAERLPDIMAKFHEAYQLRCNELSEWATPAVPLVFEIGFGYDTQASALPCLLETDGEFKEDIVTVAEAAGFNCVNTEIGHTKEGRTTTYYGLWFMAV